MNFTWNAGDIAVALVSFGATTVRTMIGVYANGMVDTWVAYIARSLTSMSYARLSQGAVLVSCATH